MKDKHEIGKDTEYELGSVNLIELLTNLTGRTKFMGYRAETVGDVARLKIFTLSINPNDERFVENCKFVSVIDTTRIVSWLLTYIDGKEEVCIHVGHPSDQAIKNIVVAYSVSKN